MLTDQQSLNRCCGTHLDLSTLLRKLKRVNHRVYSHTLYLINLVCNMQMNKHTLAVSLFRTFLIQQICINPYTNISTYWTYCVLRLIKIIIVCTKRGIWMGGDSLCFCFFSTVFSLKFRTVTNIIVTFNQNNKIKKYDALNTVSLVLN